MPFLAARNTIRSAMAVLLTGAFASLPAAAQDLPAPQGEVLLTIEGRIGATNEGDTALFDDAMLSELPQQTFTTTTIWTKDREVTFSGPSLADVLDAVDAQGSVVRARAINDYMVEFSRDELTDTAPIVANRIDGEPYGIRQNGPLWIVYPYDAGPEFQTELVYARSIWQLVHLRIEDE